jgi:hypothetical protein
MGTVSPYFGQSPSPFNFNAQNYQPVNAAQQFFQMTSTPDAVRYPTLT